MTKGNVGPFNPEAAGQATLPQKADHAHITQDLSAAEPHDWFDGLNIRYIISACLRHKVFISSIITLFLVVTFFVTNAITPLYKATAILQINQEAAKVVEVDSFQENTGSGKEYLHTQYELLKSRSLAEKVVANLGLVNDARFMQTGQQTTFSWIRKLIAKLRAVEPPAAPTLESRQRAAISILLAGLSVEPVRNSLLVNVSFSHPDPQVAQRLANGIAENFITENLNRRYEASSYARQFLEERLQQLKMRMEEAETQLVAYARDQQIFGADQQRTLTEDNLATVNTDLGKARAERTRLEVLWKFVQTPDGDVLPQVVNDRSVLDAKAKFIALSAEYQQKLKIYKPNYPDMLVLKASMDEIESQIKRAIAAGKDSIKKQYEVARNSEAALEAELDSLKTETLVMRDRGIQYGFLKREVDTNRTLYDGLLQRYKEIGIAGGVGTNNIAFVDQAILPGAPYFPNLPQNLVIALILAIFVGIALSLLLEYLDDTIKTPEDAESCLSLPVIGMIPRPKENSALEDTLLDPWSAPSEAYRSLRTALQFSTPSGTPKSLLVTSARPGDGKSTTALALACNFAQLGQRVLLIDGDLRYASLHKKIKMQNEIGLSTYLSGQINPQDAVQQTEFDNLFFMASGPMPPNPAELLAGPRLISLLGLAANQYDMVIIDAPPIMGLADALLLASLVEVTLMIVAAGQTRRDAARVAIRNLRYSRAHLLGTVLTKFDIRQVTYGYGYGYGYGHAGETYHAYGRRPDAGTKLIEDKERE